MTTRNAQLAGIATVLALTVTGCGAVRGDGAVADPAAGPSSAAADPRQALLDSVPDETVGAYAFDVRGGDSPFSGVLDAPKKAIELRLTESGEPNITLTMDIRAIGGKSWIKLAVKPAGTPGLPKIPKKWLLVDKAKMSGDGKDIVGYDGSTDPGYAADVIENGTGIRPTGAGHFAGTTDLTRSTQAEILDGKALEALGDKARKVPFEAVVGGDGHLSTLTVKIPAAGRTKARTYAVRYSGYGRTPTPTVPAAGEQQKATPIVYQLLG
ncbi:hypothetical protein ACQP2F_06675 [Actinoplanes sp. CA-030573]|uniref:hypothetical protein n=1 Tax=Actinoplanes sp. CA-030573 TaxID=3239898 RepID=UPI003D93CCFA